MLQGSLWQLLFVMARVRFLMWLNVCEAIANLNLSLRLVYFLGPVGVVLGRFFPLLACKLLVMPIYTNRAFKIPLLRLFLKGLSVLLFTGVLMARIGMACLHFAPPESWKIFFLILVSTALGGILCLAVGFRREERRELLVRVRFWRSAQAATDATPLTR